MKISQSQAIELLVNAVKEAEKQSADISVAVLDQGGNLQAFMRMEKAALITVDTAIGKAYTAVSMGSDSSVLHAISQPGQPLAGFQAMTLAPRPLVPFAGGVVLRQSDEVIAAIGVSGAASSETDEAIAKATVAQMEVI